MQRIIDRILEGSFDYENGSLDFSCTKLELTLQAGAVFEGSFTICSTPGDFTEGSVTVSDLRMECLTPVFSGPREEIAFCFHAENMAEGDVVRGEFYVVSNRGEYYLPFVVSIEHTVISSSVGNIKNLFHFANLAKSCWEEAVKLFYSPDFPGIFNGSDSKYYDLYRGLSARPENGRNVEEFLIENHKKQRIEYLTRETEVGCEDPSGVAETSLTVVRNGWGYTRLKVAAEGEFVFTEKEVLTDDDFLGNHCSLPVFIDSGMLHKGKNFGRIVLYDSFQRLTVPVVVRKGEGRGAAGSVCREKKRLLVQLMEFYQAFRLKKIGASTWRRESAKLVERMAALDEKDLPARLLQAQVMITEERFQEAGWLLSHAGGLLEQKDKPDQVLYAYYLYLTTLVNRDREYVDGVTARVELLYRQNRTSWRIAWLLLYLSGEYDNAASRWAFLEKLGAFGCSSPVIYIEALLLLNANPALLRKLGEFERSVLSYGAAQEMLTGALAEQLLYLAGRVKDYSPSLYRTLTACYLKRQDVRVLREICSLLIKGNKAGPLWYSWYRLGVEHELRITKLYEYFMMSIDMEKEQEIPRVVLMYFSYQNNLDYRRSAFLYAYILKNRDSLGELYLAYRERIESFVIDQIRREHIDRHLAWLYQELLTPGMIGEQTAPALARLLFCHLISVEQEGLANVVVCQPGSLRERVYPISEGKAWAPLYGSDCTVLFEDAEGNRFAGSVPHTIEKFLLPGKFIRLAAPFVQDNPDLDLYLSEGGHEVYGLAGEGPGRSFRLLESPYVSAAVKRELCRNLLQQLYDSGDMQNLDVLLDRLPAEAFTGKEQGEVIRYLVLRGRLEEACGWVRTCGPGCADGKVLARLTSELAARKAFARDPLLLGCAEYVFRRKKYDSDILRYLGLWFQGMIREMRDIWKASETLVPDRCGLCGRILVQMLYSGAFVGEKLEIFRDYVEGGGDGRVMLAFLAQCSYDYFVKDRVTDGYVFEEILRLHGRGADLPKVCRLAFLKYYAEKPEEMKGDVRKAVGIFLRGIMAEGVRLNFFRDFGETEDLQHFLWDKTLIEYHAHPESRVYIHYVILRENGEAGDYLTEEMCPVFGGVCFKEFILFFGESLQYYIVEQRGGSEQLTQSGSVQKSDIRSGEESKFGLINDIAVSQALQDYDTLDALLEEYYYKEYLTENLFHIR